MFILFPRTIFDGLPSWFCFPDERQWKEKFVLSSNRMGSNNSGLDFWLSIQTSGDYDRYVQIFSHLLALTLKN